MTSAKTLSFLEQAILAAFEDWFKPDNHSSPLSNLLIFQRVKTQEDCTARQATNKILNEAIKTLSADYAEHAQVLSRRYLDGDSMKTIMYSLNMSTSTVYRRRDEGIEKLALILQSQESQDRQAHQTKLKQRLERPTYLELIGVDDLLDGLTELFTSPEPPWIITLEGMGGLGKTSLADALSRRLIDRWHFDDFGWISARQTQFNPVGVIKQSEKPALTAEDLVDKLAAQLITDIPNVTELSHQKILTALQARLKQQRHCIVIDNLETLTDVETLIPFLRELSNPSKILLTSRENLHHELGIYHFPVPELNETNTLRLIKYEAQLHNATQLINAADGELMQIYKAVGGNPLAIRLVVGQTHIFALQDILNDLSAAQSNQAESLYTYIYRHVWDRLDELTRRILLAMPLVADDEGTLEHIAEVSDVDLASVRNALNWLVTLNLVDRKDDHVERYFSIHNLTRTFLHQMVLKWA